MLAIGPIDLVSALPAYVTWFDRAGDRYNTDETACPRLSHVKIGVAHRTLPCGAWITICAKRCVRAQVIDRGPYGQTCEVGVKLVWRQGLRLKPGCRWRGVVDLLPSPWKLTGTKGLAFVFYDRPRDTISSR